MAEAAELDQPRASDLEYVTIYPFLPSLLIWKAARQLTTCIRLLRSGDFADIVVTCGHRSWNCHQAILASRSDWFRKELSRPFEVRHCSTSGTNESPLSQSLTSQQDAGTRQVSLNKQTPLSVDLALKYIYGLGEHRIQP